MHACVRLANRQDCRFLPFQTGLLDQTHQKLRTLFCRRTHCKTRLFPGPHHLQVLFNLVLPGKFWELFPNFARHAGTVKLAESFLHGSIKMIHARCEMHCQSQEMC
jgi:hypothetical protein